MINYNLKKICVFTGTRADYGLLKPIMIEIENNKNLTLQLLVSGSHLSQDYGLTYKLIQKDGFKIDSMVELDLSGDKKINIARNLGNAVKLYSEELEKLEPEIVVILGDRYEALAIAQACLIMNIAIAHIHGGESSEGSIDESMRHAITKISNIHFTCADKYRNRVIQMGENPNYVFNFGAPGLDNLNILNLLTKKEIEEKLKIKLKDKIILLSYHSATLGKKNPIEVLRNIFKAFENFKNTTVLVSKSNSDYFGLSINKFLDEYCSSKKIILRESFGQQLYLSLIKISDVLVGNSSSGIIEAPSLGTPSLNIGPRQNGRLQANSIINSSEEYEDINDSLNKIFSTSFKDKLKKIINPYGSSGSSKKIVEKIASINSQDVLVKSFNDANYSL